MKFIKSVLVLAGVIAAIGFGTGFDYLLEWWLS